MWRIDGDRASAADGVAAEAVRGNPGKRTLSAAIQRVAIGPAPAAPVVAPAGGGSALAPAVAAQMSRAFASDFSAVRVHEGDHVSALGARAYALGDELHFARGEYAPDSTAGRELIGHELTHVVQQRQGRVSAPLQAKGAPVVDDPGLEVEADVAGTAAAHGAPVADHLRGATGPGGGAAAQGKLVRKTGPDEAKGKIDEIAVLSGALAILEVDMNDPVLNAIIFDDEPVLEVPFDAETAAIVDAVVAAFRARARGKGGKGKGGDDSKDRAPTTGPVKLYHGTTLPIALKLAAGLEVQAIGKGELGGAFYMTHDAGAAAHIADYYCVAEQKLKTSNKKGATHWGVVEFSVDPELLRQVQRKHIEDISEYSESLDDNTAPAAYDWMTSPIKDNSTPYLQHALSGLGLVALNHESTTRAVVAQGKVQTVHRTKVKKPDRYAQSSDERLASLGADVDAEEEEEEDAEEVGDEEDAAPAAAAGKKPGAPGGKGKAKEDDEDE